jgi:hypothetical protein
MLNKRNIENRVDGFSCEIIHPGRTNIIAVLPDIAAGAMNVLPQARTIASAYPGRPGMKPKLPPLGIKVSRLIKVRSQPLQACKA